DTRSTLDIATTDRSADTTVSTTRDTVIGPGSAGGRKWNQSSSEKCAGTHAEAECNSVTPSFAHADNHSHHGLFGCCHGLDTS
ncbi:hypothetical protein, partial [Mycolicibacterium sp.]